MKGIKRKAIFCLLFLVLIAGCNVLQDGENQPVISTSVLPSTAGSVLISGQGSENQHVELLAVANENWRFSNWSGDIESEENPLSITLSHNTQIFANFVLSGNNYRIDLQLNDGKNSSELSFGQIEGATDGFDTNLDLESPPPPPDGVLFGWFENAGKRLLNDFRNPYTTKIEWVFNVELGNTESVNLTWDISNESSISGSLILTDSNGKTPVNMIENSTVELNLGKSTQYLITYISAGQN